MPSIQRPAAAPAWTIRSVPLRTRGGPERLNQAYRRLLEPTPPQPPSGPGDVPRGRAAARAPDFWR